VSGRHAFAALAFGAVLACQVFGPADRAAVAQDAATIEKCQEEGRACKADGGANCYSVYDACMVDGGLR
jgi:hypothetical protein